MASFDSGTEKMESWSRPSVRKSFFGTSVPREAIDCSATAATVQMAAVAFLCQFLQPEALASPGRLSHRGVV